MILSSANGEYFHDTIAPALGAFGRLIDISGEDVFDHGRLEMGALAANATFAVFNGNVHFHGRPRQTEDVFQSVMSMVEKGEVGAIKPVLVWDIAECDAAFARFGRKTHVGKLVLSYENPESMVKVRNISINTLRKSHAVTNCCGQRLRYMIADDIMARYM